jgi:hypothetical protein
VAHSIDQTIGITVLFLLYISFGLFFHEMANYAQFTMNANMITIPSGIFTPSTPSNANSAQLLGAALDKHDTLLCFQFSILRPSPS